MKTSAAFLARDIAQQIAPRDAGSPVLDLIKSDTVQGIDRATFRVRVPRTREVFEVEVRRVEP